MKYVRDTTGRFRQRPHYEPAELDEECERIITDFLIGQYGQLVFPIPTDALTNLLERDAADLDLYADLSGEGTDVGGVTDFYPGKKPRVRIARELSEQAWRQNRLRTTLTHEYGHVKFHGFLWDLEPEPDGLFSELHVKASPKCKRENILGASQTDWMEWQAGYVCGAILMPRARVKQIASTYSEEHDLYLPVRAGSAPADGLVRRIVEAFDVSEEAAKVRLLKMGSLVDHDVPRSLFGKQG